MHGEPHDFAEFETGGGFRQRLERIGFVGIAFFTASKTATARSSVCGASMTTT